MSYLFSYTECEAPGPFQSRPGFKIKSLVVPDGIQVDSQLERVLNATIANFPQFVAPKVDAYASREEFLQLPKVWSYAPVVQGHFAFMRLATSGTKMGRPGNPFHQSFVVKYTERGQLEQKAEQLGISTLTPADFYFWNWPSPRGDQEVESSEFSLGELPLPQLDEFMISANFENAFSSSGGKIAVRQFEAMWLTGSAKEASLSEPDFFGLLSMLLRLIPTTYSWTMPFSNQKPTRQGDEYDPDLVGGLFNTESAPEISDQSVLWTDLLDVVVENGLHLEVAKVVQEIAELLSYSIRTKRQALVFMPLASLLLPDPSDLLADSGLRAAAWECLELLGVTPPPKSQAASERLRQLAQEAGLHHLPQAARKWIETEWT